MSLVWPDTSVEYTLGAAGALPGARTKEAQMAEMLRMARLYFVLLAITAGGRWLMGAFDVPYEEGHYFFSISILTIIS